MTRLPARSLFLAALGAIALFQAGCGGSGGSGRPGDEASLLLDFTPNAVHAGIFLARSRGFDEAEGVRLDIEPPSDSTDAVKLLSASRVDLAILDLHDLALAREKGADLVAVMPLVQRPLASVVAAPDIGRPRDLEGKRVGVSGLPSDTAVLRSIVEGDGGDPDAVRTTTIGFTAVPALLSGKVAAATAFWNAEGVALRTAKPGTRIFKLDDFGAPAYPELVLCVSRITLQDRRPLVRAVISALRRGYDEALIDPESAVSALLEEQDGLDREAVQRELEAVSPALRAGGFGRFSERNLRAWATWEATVGITKEPVDVGLAFALR
jgi:ABC-type nitrate/sulfonate/bicarbonate transport system substrate-binding protein